MSHAHTDFRLHPSCIWHSERRQRHRSTLMSSKRLPSSSRSFPRKCEEGGSGVGQPLPACTCKQRSHCSRLATPVCTDEHKALLNETFGLEPSLRATASITRRGQLRYHSLETKLRACGEQRRATFGKVLAELQWAVRVQGDQVAKLAPSINQRGVTQIRTIQVQQVERVKNQPFGMPADRCLETSNPEAPRPS